MQKVCLVVYCIFLATAVICNTNDDFPVVINTWPFKDATVAAWESLSNGNSALDAVVAGCTRCEVLQCDGTVGYGGSPDENGETTLDAMIMNGVTHDVGAVADLKRIKNAIGVARAVMEYTTHTFLVGEAASQFAISMGFEEESLSTNKSIDMYKKWKQTDCQPNFRQHVVPDPKKSCGPYSPGESHEKSKYSQRYNKDVSEHNHDTIGMVILDKEQNLVAGTSTNGANHKVPGRVGDSPVAGAGAYVDNDVGGAAATGDGDTMMRFLPSYQTVENMRRGLDPEAASHAALKRILRFYPKFSGAIVAVNKTGSYGAACHGFDKFPYCVISPKSGAVKILTEVCT
ncbi:N(4)-(Beta-N-acetylglucosaminyl)-L-asparaginase-like [Lineus longissimus]|uniref:N(4)-(Beta-N-acetylglucosaminyl)-L-asparaginase- like n=1 Tax=Lineus longissimus TaxID=88925 RepID=UPI002B4F0A85